jgi:formate hydrogenlyase transcriptional activator
LDEVGELPLDTQVKLLRVLQEQEFEPVGSSQTIRVDVRVIAATNRDLRRAIDAGQFRADLYYRLNVIPLQVPALRERRSDITALALYFMERAARKMGKTIRGISTETLERMANYEWPGNVRELQNVIERAVVLSSGAALGVDPDWLKAPQPQAPRTSSLERSSRSELAERSPRSLSMEELERAHILSVLERTGWVIEGPRGAAEILNLNPSTTRSRMKKLGIARPR